MPFHQFLLTPTICEWPWRQGAATPTSHLAAPCSRAIASNRCTPPQARPPLATGDASLLKVLYLVPNLADSAVARRIHMLRLGGAEVDVAGFRRAGTDVPDLDVGTYVELDETFDAQFAQRLWATVRARASIRRWASRLPQPDLIIARNLEMLSLAS